jgi:hypothetical protein
MGQIVDLVGINTVNRLLKEAAKAPRLDSHASRHSAVVVNRKFQAICYGHNRFDRHAEFDVLQKLFKVSGFCGSKPYALIVVRRNKTGNFIESNPCSKCLPMLRATGLKIYHS